MELEEDENKWLTCAILIETDKKPKKLQKIIKKIEEVFYHKFFDKIVGTLYEEKDRIYDRFATLYTREIYCRAPRTLDMDIIYYDDKMIMDSNKVKIPHECVQNRIYYLIPILDIE